MSGESAPASAKAPSATRADETANAAANAAANRPGSRRGVLRAAGWLCLSLVWAVMATHVGAAKRPPGHLTLDIGNLSATTLAVRAIVVDGVEARQTGRTLLPRESGAPMSAWRLTAADLPLPPPGQPAMVALHLLDPATGAVRIEQHALPERVAGRRCQVTVVIRHDGVALSPCLDPQSERLSA